MNLKSHVPDPSQPYVREFCAEIAAGQTPVRLKVTPALDANREDCFAVVDRRIDVAGGNRVLGWLIAELPGLMIEAVFHAVWCDDSGMLHDIAPQTDSFSEHLFLPDPAARYQGCQVNNIRKALRDHPTVHRLIRATNRHFEMLNRGERAEQTGAIRIPSKELVPVVSELEEATRALLDLPARRNAPCPCGSGRKFKKCCGG